MASTPVLNYDILLEILKACARLECARFMRTSRFFHTHGVKTLLSNTVTFYTEERLLCFLSYLRTPGDKRFKFVRSLAFECLTYPSEEAAQALIATLPLLSSLDKLSISCDPSEGSESLLSHPEVSAAFSMLTSVRDLSLSCTDEHAAAMLQSLRSKLVSANIDFEPFATAISFHPINFLKHSASTLESLRTSGFYWFDDPQDSALGSDPMPVYPRMRHICHEQARLGLTMPYIRAYPNLTQMTLRVAGSGSGWSPLNHAYNTERRVLNRTQQNGSDCTWKVLRKFTGILADLYVMSLACPIDEVELHDLNDKDLRVMLGPVLSDARPRRLKLPRWPKIVIGPAAFIFDALRFREQDTTRLEFLEIGLEIGLLQMADCIDPVAVLVRIVHLL